jgi:hypothetical protein
MGPGARRPSGQPGGRAGRLRRRESPGSRCRAGALRDPAAGRLPLPLLRSPGQRSRRRAARRPRRAGRCWRRHDGGQPPYGMRRVQPRQVDPGCGAGRILMRPRPSLGIHAAGGSARVFRSARARPRARLGRLGAAESQHPGQPRAALPIGPFRDDAAWAGVAPGVARLDRADRAAMPAQLVREPGRRPGTPP